MKKFKVPNLVTYVGTISSLIAIILASQHKITFAMIGLIVAGICDLFDGKFARSFKRTEEEKLVGIELDSLSDVISFLICPVVICLGMGMNKWYSYVVFVLYVVSGITRLAVFNEGAAKNNVEKPVSYYNGLPVTYAAVVFPLFWFCFQKLSEYQFQIVYTIIMLCVAHLFVVNKKIPKPRGKALVAFSLAAIVMIAAIVLS